MTTFPPPPPPPAPRREVSLPPPPPPPPPSVPTGAPPTAADILVAPIAILFALGALAQVWFAVAVTVRRHAALRLQEGRGGLSAVETGDHLVESAVIARYGLMVPAAILLAIWSVRVVRTNAWLGRRDSISPGLAAAGWFIPLANLFLPAVMVTNAWKASDPLLPPGATSADAGEKSTTPMIGAWWACWLGSLLAQILFGAAATVKRGDSVRLYRDHLERQVVLAGIGALLTIAAAVLGAIVVSRLAARQRVAVGMRLRGV